MPNPVKQLQRRTVKGLSTRQKAIVKRVKRSGLTPMGYHRAAYKGRRTRSSTSVHDPFLDIKRRADVKPIRRVKSYPHAYDTEKQSRVRLAKSVRFRKKPTNLLKSLLNP